MQAECSHAISYTLHGHTVLLDQTVCVCVVTPRMHACGTSLTLFSICLRRRTNVCYACAFVRMRMRANPNACAQASEWMGVRACMGVAHAHRVSASHVGACAWTCVYMCMDVSVCESTCAGISGCMHSVLYPCSLRHILHQFLQGLA